ncbi:MAG: TIGR00266 family protein [Nocardia sp.]|nr:TIGR00266 family protein [Nocardia sp.]
MKVQLRHSPSATVARCSLAGGEPLRAKTGAMVAHSAGVALSAKAEGGLLAGLKRSMLAGESFFVSTFTAPPQGGWVDVAPALPGDMLSVPIVPDRPFFISRGSWIGNSRDVRVQTTWGGFANMFGGEGGFGLRAQGQGEVVLGVFGAIDTFELAVGEQVTIDSGHVVAYDLAMKFAIRRAVSGRSLQSFTSGEGLVFDFSGPGRVVLQSRNPGAFAAWAGAVTSSG